MALVELKIPPGIKSHGTDLESEGRWLDSNLIRWESGSVRPVGGWTTRVASASTYAPRGSHGWVDNSGDPRIAMGTYEKLYAINYSGTVSDITPVGFTTGDLSASINVGFGGGAYGVTSYGDERSSNGVWTEATSWSLDNWGEYLVACSVADGVLYEWQLTGVAAAISNAPTGCAGLVVTDERFLMALGAGGNPRKVQWCDRENNTVWTPTATNEAGDFELATSGQIVQGIQLRGRTLILTSVDAHAAAYTGSQYVYGFEQVGIGCGSVSRMSGASIGEGALWMGANSFFMFNGSSVQPVQCEVQDKVFNNINKQQISKVFAVHNSKFNEVWWYYPSGSSIENDSYVAYDYKENIWMIGTLERTAGFDSGVFSKSIQFDASGNVYNHEEGYQWDSAEPYVESGPIKIGTGENVMHLTQMYPDELTQGQVQATFKTRFYPNDVERSYGPYSMSNPTSLRVTGRQVRMRLTATGHESWRVGVPRIDITQGGKR